MTPEDYRRAGGLFEQLRGLSPDERQPLLEAACAGRPGLSDKIVRLLEADRKATAGAFPEQRALQDAAGLIGDSQSRANLEPAIASGARLGPYQILESIGRGGMGEVYRAQDLQLHRYVAVKVLSGALAGDTHYMDRFRHEARILASLNHPNIATVYGIEQGALGDGID